ncbi:MAG: TIGR04283 family arsenosugar biosynthesis glycosyltransferase [Gammaproteobacteria bacterium]|nr:TIGR04283 family arsenosugar biosynthesis glycosyltransferase [Gammaproteobacteria bacterium]
MRFSIIIPTLNEAPTITQALQQLLNTIDPSQSVEIIVCDGGSRDDTQQLAQQFPLTLLSSPPGRARQMNTGARQASGEWLLFLHSDTRLPPLWMSAIASCNQPWGRFDLRLSGQHWLFRIIEKAINQRSRRTAVATGDQVLFFRRDFFQQLDGFAEIPLMEDIAISKKARRLAAPACLSQQVITSSRRWEHNGILKTVLLMWLLRLAYWAGIKPDRLHRLYYS